MPVTCVIGLQWGDEAKGKIVDLLTGQHDVVVRYQGGANAGHTVVWGAETYKFSLLPSGILTPSVTCVIGSGMVINPATLLDELDSLQTRAVGETAPLLISDRAHVIFPWHLAEDHALDENTADGERIGTTQRGIGPCYRDKVGRTHAVRVGDLLRDGLREKIERIVEAKRQVLAAVGEPAAAVALDPAAIDQQYRAYAERLRPHVADTTEYLMTAAEAGQRILLEGAQGSMLDVDHGTYPFVTSSNSSAVGVSSGTGLPPRYLTRVIGVMKAYSTRVGGGPFPTELLDATGQHLRERGREYGTVTNRPRRCGWIDTVALRYAARLGGIDTLCVTLLDVLSELTELKLCVAYEVDGQQRTTTFPSHVDDLRRAVPVYETVAGWRDDISAVRSFDELPAAARHYLGRLRALVGCPVQIVSVGRDREQTIYHDV